MAKFFDRWSLRGNRIFCSGACGVFALSVSLASHFQTASLPSDFDLVPYRSAIPETVHVPLDHEHAEQGKGFAKIGAIREAEKTLTNAFRVSVPSRAAVEPFERLFGTRSISVTNAHILQRWNGLLAEAADANILSNCIPQGGEFCSLPRVVAMRQEIARLKNSPRELQVRAVNEFVNRHVRYAPDRVVYGRPDHWATLRETLTQGMGDCEDFAIAKMWMLRALGVPAQSIRLVVLRDNASRQDHAVLAVHHEGGAWVLDNRFGVVRADREIRHYQPYYSLSAGGASWVHSQPVAADAPVTAAAIGPARAARLN